MSLHNQEGQIKDLAEYIKSVVSSDATMQNWPATVKELVIDTLAEKGGGMYVIMVLTPNIPFSCDEFRFRWAYCQLESLRQCPLRHIPSTLGELPETLDETYQRILQGIPKKMQKDAHHIFQWLLVSSRPLRVKEVAEVFAINFDEKISGIPKFKPSWRVPNAETAVLSACSTLVSTVDAGWRGKIVQFSHFSVKEYLTSDRIANAEHVSHFYIRPKLAHTLLAKACLSVLFQREYSIYEAKIKNFPLAEYAAKHWVEHARFEDVSSYIRDGMDLLFEKDKPHFASWIWLHNIDDEYDIYNESTAHLRQPDAVPLYYAALCGFRGLVQRLLTAYPRDLNAEGDVYGAPLNAALAQGHLDIALFLLDRGADVDNRGKADQTGLYIASSRGYAGIVRSLIDASAELNAICKDHDEDGNIVKRTPLHVAIYEEHRDIAILLLEHGADTEIRSSPNQTALYMASSRGHADVVRALIDCGADLNVQCDDWMDDVVDVTWTPLHAAIYDEHRDVALLLLEGGADTESRNSDDETALYMASSRGCADIVRQLISHGADLNARCTDFDMYDNDVKWTPLHVASCNGIPPIVRLLLDHGADPNALDNLGRTALHLASSEGKVTVVKLLLDYGANVDVWDKDGWTPLHKAAYLLHLHVVVALINGGADPHAQTNKGETPIQLATAPLSLVSKEDQAQIIRFLAPARECRVYGHGIDPEEREFRWERP